MECSLSVSYNLTRHIHVNSLGLCLRVIVNEKNPKSLKDDIQCSVCIVFNLCFNNINRFSIFFYFREIQISEDNLKGRRSFNPFINRVPRYSLTQSFSHSTTFFHSSFHSQLFFHLFIHSSIFFLSFIYSFINRIPRYSSFKSSFISLIRYPGIHSFIHPLTGFPGIYPFMYSSFLLPIFVHPFIH